MSTDLHCTTVLGGQAECTCGWRSMQSFFDAHRLAAWHRLAVGEVINNPYLREFLAPATSAECDGSGFVGALMRRERLVAEYAWAIPTEIVVRRLAEFSPICDLGCGTGYWAKLLVDVGAEVIAVDARPPLEGHNHCHRSAAFADILRSDAATFDVPPGHALMLCWPPYSNDMAAQAITRYRGDRVIYVGEGLGGCTGDDTFHEMLAAHWNQVARYEIPQWDAVHDAVRVYARRSS